MKKLLIFAFSFSIEFWTTKATTYYFIHEKVDNSQNQTCPKRFRKSQTLERDIC
jgi:hypothetical protein